MCFMCSHHRRLAAWCGNVYYLGRRHSHDIFKAQGWRLSWILNICSSQGIGGDRSHTCSGKKIVRDLTLIAE